MNVHISTLQILTSREGRRFSLEKKINRISNSDILEISHMNAKENICLPDEDTGSSLYITTFSFLRLTEKSALDLNAHFLIFKH